MVEQGVWGVVKNGHVGYRDEMWLAELTPLSGGVH